MYRQRTGPNSLHHRDDLVDRPRAILSPSHSRTLALPHSHTLTLPHFHPPIVSDSHTLTLSNSHTPTLSHSPTLALSHSHTLTLSHSHTNTLADTLPRAQSLLLDPDWVQGRPVPQRTHMKMELDSNLSGNKVDHTNSSILLVTCCVVNLMPGRFQCNPLFT